MTIAQDHWVRAVDMRPGNPQVVHHAILFEDISGTARKRDTGSGYDCFGTPGFLPARGLGGWTPGSLPYQAPDDMPELLHAHADLVLQVHYHPFGRAVTDRTARGAVFHRSQAHPARPGYPARLQPHRHSAPATAPTR